MTKPINPPQDTNAPANDALDATVSDSSDSANSLSTAGINPSELSDSQKRVWERQERFLAGYAVGGTIKAGRRHANVSYDAVELWRKQDVLGFRARFAAAQAVFCDSLEDIALDLVRQLKPGQTPVLLLALLNANLPEKYRPNAVVSDNTAAELLSEIRKLGRKQRPAASSPDSESEGNVTQLRPQRGA